MATRIAYVVQTVSINEFEVDAASSAEALAAIITPLNEWERDHLCYVRIVRPDGTGWMTSPTMQVAKLARFANLPPGEVLSAMTLAPAPPPEAPRREG